MFEILIERYTKDLKSLKKINSIEGKAYKKLLKKVISDLEKVKQLSDIEKTNQQKSGTVYPVQYANTNVTPNQNYSSSTSSSDIYSQQNAETIAFNEALRIQESAIRVLNNNGSSPIQSQYNQNTQTMTFGNQYSQQAPIQQPIQQQTTQTPSYTPQNTNPLIPSDIYNQLMNKYKAQEQRDTKGVVNKYYNPFTKQLEDPKIPNEEELQNMINSANRVAVSMPVNVPMSTGKPNPFTNDPLIRQLKNVEFKEEDLNEIKGLFSGVGQSIGNLPIQPDLSQILQK